MGRLKKDIFKVAGQKLSSRLIVGTGKYKSFSETAKAVHASGAVHRLPESAAADGRARHPCRDAASCDRLPERAAQ